MTEPDFPYEATFLSAFGVALGMAIGQREVWTAWNEQIESLRAPGTKVVPGELALPPLRVSPGTLSSYAGSHRDFVYGDALAAVRGRGLIIEFKRELKDWATEVDPKKKPHKIRVLERISALDYKDGKWKKSKRQGDPLLPKISELGHWFAFGKSDDEQQDTAASSDSLELCFAPYLRLIGKSVAIKASAVSISEFLRRLLDSEVGASLDELAVYLAAVGEAAEGDSGSGQSGSEIHSNGVLTYIDHSGRTRLIWFRSIHELITKFDEIDRLQEQTAPHRDEATTTMRLTEPERKGGGRKRK